MQRFRTPLIAGTLIAFAVAALLAQRDGVAPARGRVAVASSEPVALAHDVPGVRALAVPVHAAMQGGARQSPAPASVGKVDVNAVPIREAIDSGRAQPVFLSLVAPAQIRAGERFVALVNAETENDVARMLVTLRYDPTRLRVVSAHAGDFMKRAGAKFEFSYSEEPRRSGVTLQLVEDPMGPLVAGGGTAAAVEFQAIADGETQLALDGATLFDLDNEGVAFSLAAASRVSIVP